MDKGGTRVGACPPRANRSGGAPTVGHLVGNAWLHPKVVDRVITAVGLCAAFVMTGGAFGVLR